MLLDTCALVWLSTGGGKLSAPALASIEQANAVHVSSISAWEVALKHHRGTLELPCDPARWFQEVLKAHDLTEVALDSEVAVASTRLPEIHRDPCDRFIIATARLRGWPVVTADDRFPEYGVEVLA